MILLSLSKTVDEQLKRLEPMFQRIRQHGLKLKFSLRKLRYLGNVISQDDI